MSDELENANVVVDGEVISLADLAGISMDDVKELRMAPFPKGMFVWEVDRENPPAFVVIGEGKAAKAAARFPLKCIEVIGVTDSEFTDVPDSLVGKLHYETLFITTMDGLGYLKAFLKDIGAPYDPNLKTMLHNSGGTRFQAPIIKRKDKNDSDKTYTNVNRDKMKPLIAA